MGAMTEELRKWQCDVDGAMERFLDDEELYTSCLYAVLDDPSFEGLGKALREHRIQEAFDHAHTLKGVLANMGLTPMYDLAVQIVEPLRAGTDENLLSPYEELLQAKRHLAGILGG